MLLPCESAEYGWLLWAPAFLCRTVRRTGSGDRSTLELARRV